MLCYRIRIYTFYNQLTKKAIPGIPASFNVIQLHQFGNIYQVNSCTFSTMRSSYPGLILALLVITALSIGGCTSKASDTTAPTAIPTPAVIHVNTSATPVPVPARPNLTAEDLVFLRNAIDQESASIKMIGDTIILIKSGRTDSAKSLAESAEKNLKSEYTNLSAQSVSPALQPVKDEIMEAIRDEINGSRKLRNIAVSDSEGMLGASKDYREAADELFKSANAHLNNAQSRINALSK
jgi:hypothetical protein